MLGSTAFATDYEPSTLRDTIEFEGRQWRCDLADEVVVVEYRGKTALRVRGGPTAAVYLPEVEFQDGVIEVDFATPGRSAPGIGFRGHDNGMWHNEIKFNRWPGENQDKRVVVEQAVVTRRANTVLLLNTRGPGFSSIRDKTEGPDWFHVKVVVQGDRVQVYLNGDEEPTFEVGAVFDGNRSGALGLCGGDFFFKNFKYTAAERVVSAVTD